MMNPKMIKILRKGNDREFLKLNEVRKETARINARLKPYQLDRPVKTVRDVYTPVSYTHLDVYKRQV